MKIDGKHFKKISIRQTYPVALMELKELRSLKIGAVIRTSKKGDLIRYAVYAEQVRYEKAKKLGFLKVDFGVE